MITGATKNPGLDMADFVSKIVLLVSVALLTASSAYPLEGEKVIAVVNGEAVTAEQYERFLLKIDPTLRGESFDDKLLKKMIEEKIILQEAVKAGLTISDKDVEESIDEFLKVNSLSRQDFEKRIKDQGMTLGEYRKWLKEDIILLAKMIDKEVNGKVSVGDDEIEGFYRQNSQRYVGSPELMRVKAIYMRVGDNTSLPEMTFLKIRALRIRAELKKGGDFEQLAALYSEDPSRKYDGTLGEFRKGELVPALDKKLSSMKEGEISDPIWVKEGVYILKMGKRTKESLVPVDSVREDIRRDLLQKKRDARYAEWVQSLWKRSSVQISPQ